MNHRKFNMWVLLLLCIVVSHFANAQHPIETHQNLDEGQKSIIKIASFTAKGDLEALKISLHEGLDNGLTVNEAKEVLVHLYAYCGFPRSIRGLQTLISVLDERKEDGIKENWGNEASTITDTRDKYTRGKEILEALVKAKLDGPKPAYQQLSPEIDVFLKEHLFADIFERDVLTYAQRELVTISVIATLGNLVPMLQGHLNISLNVGLSANQLEEFISVITTTAGKEHGYEAQKVLDAVLENRN
ncbi:carboxymuconolactone decarboxylase family protein [Chondrinema litorale]|uniref:carboxymuconolactone decarboxylase family protein n=1 Tax=Chondrinema litorale TaxID=2994555 RepID=UPI002542D598|nr:carboxymuconolactone decarboxylase family protein [Chondrinema litorale]UZR98981.1 carboxymuconolactone decarboxylase family protein [Chondrinema litorale]